MSIERCMYVSSIVQNNSVLSCKIWLIKCKTASFKIYYQIISNLGTGLFFSVNKLNAVFATDSINWII